MTFLNRFLRRSPADATPVIREGGVDAVMILLIALVFLPVVGVHVAFAFGPEPAGPAAIERAALPGAAAPKS